MYEYDDLTQVLIDGSFQSMNWQGQYRLITQWGKLIQVKPNIRHHEHAVRGCETPAWLMHHVEQGVHRFVFDSDSRVINGLAALLLSYVDNKTTDEILQVQLEDILKRLGLEKHLTPSRNNGIKIMIAKINESIKQ